MADKLITAMVIAFIICLSVMTISLLLFVIHSIWGNK